MIKPKLKITSPSGANRSSQISKGSPSPLKSPKAVNQSKSPRNIPNLSESSLLEMRSKKSPIKLENDFEVLKNEVGEKRA